MTARESTELISRLAADQDGVVNRHQLLGEGVSSTQIDSRLKNGSFRQLYAGVYAVGHDRLSLLGRQRAAVMSGGPNAVLSHRSAASLLGLLPPSRRLEVIRSSSPDPHRPRPKHASHNILPGLIIHRTRSLTANEITHKQGIPVTTGVRTIINLAEIESPRTLDMAVRRGVAKGCVEIGELVRAVDSARGRKGVAKLRKVLENWNPRKLRSKSEFENAVSDLCRDYGAPPPLINDRRCGYEVDFQWEGSNVLIEADGFPFHLSKADRHRDFQKMLDLTSAGNVVIRVDEAMVFEGRHELGMRLRKMLEDEGRLEIQPLSPQPVAVSDRGPP